MTRQDFIAAVAGKRGAPDGVEHFKSGVALHYGQAAVTANDREIRLNEGDDWDRMVNVRLSHAKGLKR